MFHIFSAKHPPLSDALSFIDEATVLQQFDHPNVLSLAGIAIKDNIPKIMTPYMANGDLKGYLKQNQKVTGETGNHRRHERVMCTAFPKSCNIMHLACNALV